MDVPSATSALTGVLKFTSPPPRFDGGLAACIQFGEGNDGHAHAVAGAVHEEGFPENVDAVARVGVLELFVEGADEDDAPEALDGSLSLGAAVQPLEHGDAAGFLEVAGFAFGGENFEHGAGDGNFVADFERRKGEERAGHVKWSGQDARFHGAAAALGIEKNEAVEKFNFVRGADAAVEIGEVGAAAESYVLAIIDVLAAGENVGGGAAAEKRFLFEQPYAPAGFSQRDAARQSRQAAADHDRAFQ